MASPGDINHAADLVPRTKLSSSSNSALGKSNGSAAPDSSKQDALSRVLKVPASVRYAQLLTFLTSVTGRDKMYRSAQFLFKVVAWLVENYHPLGDKNAVSVNLVKIANGFSTGRRFVRIGSAPGAFQSIRQSIENPDVFVRLVGTMSKSASFLYILLDHSGWIARCGVYNRDNDYWAYWESMCWLLSLVFGTLLDLYNRQGLALQEESLRKQCALNPDDSEARTKLDAVLAKTATLDVNFARNMADFPLALNGVFKIKSIPSIMYSCLGLTSSLIGAYQAWPSK